MFIRRFESNGHYPLRSLAKQVRVPAELQEDTCSESQVERYKVVPDTRRGPATVNVPMCHAASEACAIPYRAFPP